MYKELRKNGMTAIEAFNRAKAGGVWADVKPRKHVYYNSDAQATRVRWVENATTALRFVKFADEICSHIRHQGWYTDTDGDNGEVLRGAVYRLPHNRYVAGYADVINEGCARIDFISVYDDELNAAYAADKFAEREADSQREYNSAWQAGSDYARAGEELATARQDTLILIREIKAKRPGGAICEALRSTIKSSLREIQKLRDKRAELLEGHYGTLAHTFNDGAGETVISC